MASSKFCPTIDFTSFQFTSSQFPAYEKRQWEERKIIELLQESRTIQKRYRLALPQMNIENISFKFKQLM